MAYVLIVDDHPAVADAVAALLKVTGHEPATVHSGAAALEYVRSHVVDLMVLDVAMPGLSGLDVLRSLRAQGALPGLPVVMFSASEGTRDEAMRLGAAGYVFKGDADALLDLVTQHAGAVGHV